MNAHAFRHFYAYHFAENRKIWDSYVTTLSHEQFTQDVNYSHGSVRDQIVHLMSDETQHVFQQLLAVIQGFPDDVRVEHIEPAFYLVWVDGERFLTGEFFNHFHDDHEPDIRAWLARVEKQ